MAIVSSPSTDDGTCNVKQLMMMIILELVNHSTPPIAMLDVNGRNQCIDAQLLET